MAEKVDIPVYRPQRQIRDPGFKFIVYPLGAGMFRGGLNRLQNGLPLIAVFPGLVITHYKTLK
jgi:hypothetical protein